MGRLGTIAVACAMLATVACKDGKKPNNTAEHAKTGDTPGQTSGKTTETADPMDQDEVLGLSLAEMAINGLESGSARCASAIRLLMHYRGGALTDPGRRDYVTGIAGSSCASASNECRDAIRAINAGDATDGAISTAGEECPTQ